MKNEISPDYRFVLQNLLSFSDRDIKPADKVFDNIKLFINATVAFFVDKAELTSN